MIVKIKLDPKAVWELTELAEKQQMTLSDFLGHWIMSGPMLRKRTPRSPERQKRIVELHGEGFTDTQIAEQLECVRAYVVQIRRRHGLEPNRKRQV